MTSGRTAHPILSGVVVVERMDRPAVSICGSLLAELGATVLQVPGAACDIGLSPQARDKAARFAATGKTWIALDLATGKGGAPDAWQRLVARADIVLIGHQGAEDAALLARESSRRIMCALSAFGLDAPAGTPEASESVLQAIGGIMAATGMRGGAPERANIPIVEMFAALNATVSILAALSTGGRALLDIAGFDSAVALLATCVATVEAGRVDGYRLGCGHHLCSPWNVYRTKDGWIQICSTTDAHWQAILRLIGRDDLSAEPRFAKNTGRLREAPAVDEVIGAWTAGRSSDEAFGDLFGAGIPVGRVRTVSQLVRDPDLAARGVVVGADLRPGSFLSAGLAARGAGAAEERPPRAHVDTVLAALGPASTRPDGTGLKPLHGIRVVEIGAYTAGPLAGRYLADLGAEVIKVEPAGGEESRAWMPQFGGHSGYFVNCNIGKASVVLDLKAEPDRQRFVELVRTADVFLESLRPGALDKIGLGPGHLQRLVPDLIYCSLSGFGRTAGARPALDTVVQADAGLMWLVGEGEQPQRVGISIADQAAAHAAPLLILAALRERDLSGKGRDIDLSMRDVLAWTSGLAWPDGEPALTRWATLAVADGWVLAREGGPAGAVLAQAETVTRRQAVHLLAAAGIEAVGVLEMGEVFAHEAVRRRGLVQYVAAEDGTKLAILSSPHRIGHAPLRCGRLPGPPGADTDAILGAL